MKLNQGLRGYRYQQLQQQKVLSAAAKTWLASSKVLLQVPDSISTDLKHFNTDPEAIMTQRAHIAKAIVEGEKHVK